MLKEQYRDAYNATSHFIASPICNIRTHLYWFYHLFILLKYLYPGWVNYHLVFFLDAQHYKIQHE